MATKLNKEAEKIALPREVLEGIVENITSAVPTVAIYIFGSYARGEADSDSDIDICVEYENGFSLFLLGGLGKQLEDMLGIPVDIVCGEDSFYPRAKKRYLEDRVLVYERR